MAANGFGQNTTDHGTNELQLRQTGSLRRSNSTSSAIGRLSHPEHVGDQLPEDTTHHSSISIPFTGENSTENGVFFNQLIRNGSVGWASSSGASLRRLFSLPGAYCTQLDPDVEDELVSEAGDSGDRALTRRGSQRKCPHFFLDEGDVFPIPDFLLKPCSFSSHVSAKPTVLPPVSELLSEIVTPEPTNAVLHDNHEEEKKLRPSLNTLLALYT